MFNKTMVILALTLSAGAVSAAQAGEGSVDSDNNVIGTQQYLGDAYGYGYGYQYGVPDSVIVGPGYATSSEPMIEDDLNTGYAPPDMADDYSDEPSNP